MNESRELFSARVGQLISLSRRVRGRDNTMPANNDHEGAKYTIWTNNSAQIKIYNQMLDNERDMIIK